MGQKGRVMKNHKGFTLGEVLVFLLTLGVLAVPVYLSIRSKPQDSLPPVASNQTMVSDSGYHVLVMGMVPPDGSMSMEGFEAIEFVTFVPEPGETLYIIRCDSDDGKVKLCSHNPSQP